MFSSHLGEQWGSDNETCATFYFIGGGIMYFFLWLYLYLIFACALLCGMTFA